MNPAGIGEVGRDEPHRQEGLRVDPQLPVAGGPRSAQADGVMPVNVLVADDLELAR